MTYDPQPHCPERLRLEAATREAQDAFERLRSARQNAATYLARRDEDHVFAARFEERALALGCAYLTWLEVSGEVEVPTREILPEGGDVEVGNERGEPVGESAPHEPPVAREPAVVDLRGAVRDDEDLPDDHTLAHHTMAHWVDEEDGARGVIEVTADIAQELEASMKRGAPIEDQVALEPDRAIYASKNLARILSTLGKPGKFKSKGNIKSELGTLRNHTSEEALAAWLPLPPDVRLQLAHYVAARCRALQLAPARYTKKLDLKEEVATIFSRLRAHLESDRAGFVHGLALDHSPRGASWADDVESWRKKLDASRERHAPTPKREPLNTERALHELSQLVEKKVPDRALVYDLLEKKSKGLDLSDRRVARALEARAQAFPKDDPRFKDLHAHWSPAPARQAPEPSVPEPIVDPSWSHWGHVHRGRLLLVGGDRHAHVAARLEEELELASLDWQKLSKKAGGRRLNATCKRIAHGSIDLVLILKSFISHKFADKLVATCKNHSVPFAVVEKGYGSNRIIEAIERYLEPAPQATEQE